jgi:pimeloyl-ACP methyl ester carboxylesterase
VAERRPARSKQQQRKRAGLIAGAVTLGLGAAITAGVAAERAFLRRERRRPDPYRDEPYGELRGTSIGPVASFDGTLLHVAEAGSGPAAIFSHGFSLNSTLWHHQVKELASDMRVVVYDHRGHGRSGLPPSADWSLEALARDLDAVIEDAAVGEDVVLVGHSMGGMTVLKYCEMFPHKIGPRVRGLVLVDTTSADVMGGALPGYLRRIEAAFQGLEQAGLRALAGRADHVDRVRARGRDLVYIGTRLMAFGRDPSPTQVAFVEKMLAEVPSEVWLNLIPAMLGVDATEALPAIDVPALVVVGDRDRLTPLSAARRIADSIPQAELLVVENAGHTPMLERQEFFNAQIRRFCARVRQAGAAR